MTDTNMTDRKLTIAIQKKGRLADDTFALLKAAGLKFQLTDRSLKADCKNFPMEMLLLRAGDVPGIVEKGLADIGITGQNSIAEDEADVVEVMGLGFGGCTLNLAYPDTDPNMDVDGKRIATSYPNILKSYLAKLGKTADIVELSGSVEIAPKLDFADAICDLVSTGSTLKSNGLVKGEEVFTSEAALISTKNITDDKTAILEKLLLRINAVQMAKQYKYVVMNAARENLSNIVDCLPGLKKPTVSPLGLNGDDANFVSIATVVEEDVFWSTIEKLKDNGATGILVMPIEKMVV